VYRLQSAIAGFEY